MKARTVPTNSISTQNLLSARGGIHLPSQGVVWLLAFVAALTPGLAQAGWVYVYSPGSYGTVSPSPGWHYYSSGTVVSIQASPAVGQMFMYWSWDGPVTITNRYSNSTTMTVTGSGDAHLSASFTAQWFQTLVVCTPTNGTVDPEPGTHVYYDQYDKDLQPWPWRVPTIVIHAQADPGYKFDQWVVGGPAKLDQPRNKDATLKLDDLPNTTITLCPKFVKLRPGEGAVVPSVVGMTESQATAALTAAGLAVGTITRVQSQIVPKGQVMSQSYDPGLTLELGSKVNLTASGGSVGVAVARWKLDETQGTTALDSIGGYSGTLNGGPTWLPTGGQIGGALRFDGNNDYVSLPLGPLINGLTRSTFMAWVNWTGRGGSGQHIFDFGSTPTSSMFLTPNEDIDARLRFAISVPLSDAPNQAYLNQVTAAFGLPTGWHHVAVTIDPDNHTHLLYLDGEVVAENPQAHYTPSMLDTTQQNLLGRSQASTDAHYKGELDDFRIYDVALTNAQILAVMMGED